ncbi:hypothetical protein ANO11243_015540 [Dothideomycetidae sp. 11243]|nr:hypothetical protein ANO11243_015540 [fungal sp. No.11243]
MRLAWLFTGLAADCLFASAAAQSKDILTTVRNTWSLTTRQAATNNYFISPPVPEANHAYQNNPVYVDGSKIELQWQTNYERITVIWYQNDNSSYQILDNLGKKTTGRFGEAALTTGENVFFFQIYNAADASNSEFFSSHYFNITEGNSATSPSSTSSASSTSGATTASSTASVSISASQTSSTSVSGTATSSPTSSTSALPFASPSASKSGGGLSEGAKVGLGVGLGIGVLALLAIGAILGLLLRRRRDNHTHGDASSSTPYGQQAMRSASQPYTPTLYNPSSDGSQVPVYSHYDTTIPAMPPPHNVQPSPPEFSSHHHTSPAEMPTDGERQELYSPDNRFELK